MKKLLLGLLLGTVAFAQGQQQRATVTLGWQPSPHCDGNVPNCSEAAGYALYYGFQPGVYYTRFNVGNVKQFTLNRLPTGLYYFIVTAYNAGGVEGAPSNEISQYIGGHDEAIQIQTP